LLSLWLSHLIKYLYLKVVRQVAGTVHSRAVEALPTSWKTFPKFCCYN